MPIPVSCPDCEKVLRVPEEKRGKRVKCPGCGSAVQIPSDDDDDEPIEDLPSRRRPAKGRKKGGKRKQGNQTALFVAIGGGVAFLAVAAISLVFLLPRTPAAPAGSPQVTSGGTASATVEPWQTFRHATAGFSVDVPKALQRVAAREEPGTEFHAIQLRGSKPYGLYVHYTTFPNNVTAGKTTSFVLNTSAKFAAGPGQITQRSTVQHQGKEGLEIVIALSKGFRRSRLFLHRGSVIEFGAVWEGYEPVAERERFWNSIQFTD